MTILWKPTGALDINTEPTDLPEQGDGKGNSQSGAMVRCKNLDISRVGMLATRSGSRQLVNFGAFEPIVYLFEAGGNRYEFGGAYSYYNESTIATGGQVNTPIATPSAGSYTVAQSVVLTCGTARAVMHYTLDGTIPTEQSTTYSGPVLIPLGSYLTFYAVDPWGYLSDSEVVAAYYADAASKQIVSEDLSTVITESSSNLMTEGT